MATFKLTSSSFEPGEWIPKDNSKDGLDRSPALEWEGVPSNTQELALICEDPYAPRPEPWVHWVLYKVPPEIKRLPEGILTTEKLDSPQNALQGTNSFGDVGYGGPQPPPNEVHHYYFRLYALDTKLDLEPSASQRELVSAMEGHIVATAELMGKYQREVTLRQVG